MSDLASALLKINDIETAQNAPVSEATIQKVGSTLNGVIDDNAFLKATATPTTFVVTTIAVGGSYTTPNNKQIYLVIAIASVASGGHTFDCAGCCVQGRNFVFKDNTNVLALNTLSIGGTGNKTVSLNTGTAAVSGSTTIMVFYEP